MTRRQFGNWGLSGLGGTLLAGLAWGQERSNQAEVSSPAADDMYRSCAKACADCQRECDSCSTHCAQMLRENKKEHYTTLTTCQDCADFCAAAAQIVARGGPFAALICQACAEACARCGKECEKYPEDRQMKACAEVCRTCEKACNDMTKHAGQGR